MNNPDFAILVEHRNSVITHTVSLHAMEGHRRLETLRVHGTIGKHEVTILIYTNNT